jgi:uncharacterized repeat protein (TIGR01451 family)
MKNLFCTALTLLAGAAMAQNTALVLTLTAPAELQLGQADVYRLSVRNSGLQAAANVFVRMALPPGMTTRGLPLSPCAEVSDVYGNASGVRQVRCGPFSLAARKVRDFSITLVAPAMPQTVGHTLLAAATNAPPASTPAWPTVYANFSAQVVPGSTWVISRCSNGAAGPLADNICPAGSAMSSNVLLDVGGALVDLEGQEPGYTWVQNNAQVLRIETRAASTQVLEFVNLFGVINSRCLRGPGESVPLLVGDPTIYSAAKICRL